MRRRRPFPVAPGGPDDAGAPPADSRATVGPPANPDRRLSLDRTALLRRPCHSALATTRQVAHAQRPVDDTTAIALRARSPRRSGVAENVNRTSRPGPVPLERIPDRDTGEMPPPAPVPQHHARCGAETLPAPQALRSILRRRCRAGALRVASRQRRSRSRGRLRRTRQQAPIDLAREHGASVSDSVSRGRAVAGQLSPHTPNAQSPPACPRPAARLIGAM